MDIFTKKVLMPVLDNIQTRPDNNAFCIADNYYSYREFGCAISRIVANLENIQINNHCIGLVANDDLETYASIFALWLKGMAYVPLHPNQPLARCNEIRNQVGMDLILDSSQESRYDGKVVMTSLLPESEIILKVQESYSEDDLAYILFTSGSTGKPKGVSISRKNVGSFIDSFFKSGITITDKDRCLQSFDLTFDVSVQSYLSALTKGACVYTIPHNVIKYTYIFDLIDEKKITFGAMAPSMVRYLRPYFDEIYSTDLKYCILTAEASTEELVREWQERVPNCQIYDFYGPTEGTIYCTYYKVPKTGPIKTTNGILSIGRPMDGFMSMIIDEDGNVVSKGEKGELCISGSQVTPGYWKNEENNKRAFFVKDNVRYYHTGDLCYQDEDGDILYLGRLDTQVKIQGFRVELSEIEFVAREFYNGDNAVALAVKDHEQLDKIVLFIERSLVNGEELIQYLKTKLTPYMIPSYVIPVAVFPLNANGKVDKNQLRKLFVK